MSDNDLGEVGRKDDKSEVTSDLTAANSEAQAAFRERMNVLIERSGGVGALARAAGLSRRVIDKYRSGESDPSRERLVALARGGRVSVEWLASGEGSPEARALELSEDVVALPRFDVTAAAGSGSQVIGENVVDSILFRREWLRSQLGINPSRLVVISAAGDSMAPTIEDGDLLVVDVGDYKWKSDGVYVIGVEDEVWVKRLARRLDGAFVVSSDNPRYAHTTQAIERADLRSLRLIGRVVWVGGRI